MTQQAILHTVKEILDCNESSTNNLGSTKVTISKMVMQGVSIMERDGELRVDGLIASWRD